MIRLELVQDCREEVWDDLVATHKEGTIFHTWAWMQIIEKIKQARKLPVGIYEGATLVGVLPLFRLQRGPWTVLASPLGGVGYGGPLVEAAYWPEMAAQLDDLLRRFAASYIEFRLPYDAPPLALGEHRYTVQALQTIVLSLAPGVQELWRNLKGSCRTSVRRARKEGVQIVEATGKNFLDVYYEMAVDTFGKSGRLPPLSKQDYATAWDILRPHERIKVLLAQHENQTVAGAIFLLFNQKAFYWDGASFRAHYRLSPNNLLHWALIEWAAGNGLQQYDMLGANIPSIARFKKSFGGEYHSYIYAYKDATLPVYVGRQLYHRFSPWIRKVKLRLGFA